MLLIHHVIQLLLVASFATFTKAGSLAHRNQRLHLRQYLDGNSTQADAKALSSSVTSSTTSITSSGAVLTHGNSTSNMPMSASSSIYLSSTSIVPARFECRTCTESESAALAPQGSGTVAPVATSDVIQTFSVSSYPLSTISASNSPLSISSGVVGPERKASVTSSAHVYTTGSGDAATELTTTIVIRKTSTEFQTVYPSSSSVNAQSSSSAGYANRLLTSSTESTTIITTRLTSTKTVTLVSITPSTAKTNGVDTGVAGGTSTSSATAVHQATTAGSSKAGVGASDCGPPVTVTETIRSTIYLTASPSMAASPVSRDSGVPSRLPNSLFSSIVAAVDSNPTGSTLIPVYQSSAATAVTPGPANSGFVHSPTPYTANTAVDTGFGSSRTTPTHSSSTLAAAVNSSVASSALSFSVSSLTAAAPTQTTSIGSNSISSTSISSTPISSTPISSNSISSNSFSSTSISSPSIHGSDTSPESSKKP